MNFVEWHSKTLADHISLTTQYQAQGYGFITWSVYGATASPNYAAVMIQPSPAPQHLYPSVPGDQWQQIFDSEAAGGYGPTIIAATGPASAPLYAAVFEPQNPIPLTRSGLPQGCDPWQLEQINNFGKTAGPRAVGDLFICIYNNQMHFSYRDSSGNILDSWYDDSSGWQMEQINNGALGPPLPAVSNPFLCAYNGQLHYTYIDASGDVLDFWYDGAGGWHWQAINNGGMTVGPPAVGGLFVCVYNGQQHFSYLDVGGTIQDAWYDGSWHLDQVNGGMTFWPAAVGDLFVCVYNGQLHFSYRDSNFNIQDIWFDGSWQIQRINNLNQRTPPVPEPTRTDGPAAVGGLFVSVYNNQQHFSYLDVAGNIQDAWYDGSGGWHLQHINNGGMTGGPPAVGDLFVCVYNNQQHFIYRDANGNIQDAWYENTWNFQTINNTGVTGGPAAAGGLFVCVYKNSEQHFGYLDGSGNIQDAWYNGGSITIQAMDAQAKRQGLILRCAAAYGDASDPAYTAIWVPNTDSSMWNNDGIIEDPTTYQGRFDAQFSGWCRPSFVTLNASGQYLSLFVDNQVGPWQAQHVLTPDQYQNTLDTWKQQGYCPVCVQAAGPDANSATFSAIAVITPNLEAKQFSATGPVANAGIDAAMREHMTAFNMRHASLGIVQGTRLVYARGYTLAEPGWPIAYPTTHFRIASVSKTPTALAIFQLIAHGRLHLEDRLQDILQLTTPSGGPPVDPNFQNITIQHLLEHTSGLPGTEDSVKVRDAFNASLPPNQAPYQLPVTAAMVDSYVASLNLSSIPGATQVYSGSGYQRLASVVAKKHNRSRPIDALREHLFKPLSITRIRRAVSLVANQPADEARYQNFNLNLYCSEMSDAQPLVPDMYGNSPIPLEIEEGSGGLSGATTDMARLVAILLSQKDNPALKRNTLDYFLARGAALTASGNPRAGYGFDGLLDLGSGKVFYGQKGGSTDAFTAQMTFDGSTGWGFIVAFGNGNPAQGKGSDWTQDCSLVMNMAKSVNWTEDLFPHFGMPPL